MEHLLREIPVIDAAKKDDRHECQRVAEALAEVGCLAFRGTSVDSLTPLVTDMLVRYFRQPDELKDRDVRRELHFQVGRTPPFVENARPRPDAMAGLQPHQYPTPFSGADAKERYFAPVGTRPDSERFKNLNMPPVIPVGFPAWETLTTAWGEQAIDVMAVVSLMAARGFGLPDDAFTDLLVNGPHLFAPTGSDLSKFGNPGTVLAAWHDDLNFLSVHGKANYRGLRVWKRNGDPIWVKVPDGCMVVQAGQQFEHLTGGAVLAGLHEVVMSEDSQPRIQQELAAGNVPWRVLTTMFGHVASDQMLQPLRHFATAETLAKYPPMTAGEQVLRELRLLGLAT